MSNSNIPVSGDGSQATPTPENNITPEATKAPAATPVDLPKTTPDVDPSQYAAFQEWQSKQAIETKRNELLAPLGGVQGYNDAIAKIQSTGNIKFLEEINAELGQADKQAIAIAKIKTHLDVLNTMKPAERKPEQPMFDSVLPPMGSSGATPEGASGASDPKIQVSNTVSFDGIKDPAVAEAVKAMGQKMGEYLKENPNNYKGQHLAGLKAMADTLGPVVSQAEAFGDYPRAEEALKVVSQVYSQLAKQGAVNKDKTLIDMFQNAKDIVFQADGIETTIQSDRNAKLSYKKSMFDDKFGSIN